MSHPLPTTIIEPPRGWISINFRELWRYRDLLLLMIWRDISARFRQSIIGYGWAVVRPLVSAAIFTLVFHVFVRVKTEIPYPIFAFAGLIPWMYFSTTFSGITGSVVSSSSLIRKVYFPRLLLPLSTVFVGLVELALQFVVLLMMMVFYRYTPGWPILTLPFFVLVIIFTALAFGIWLTALNVAYRDIGMAVPFIVQIWMYLCPIVYPISSVPEKFQALYALNPMVGVIEGFRWSLLGGPPPNWAMLSISMCVVIVVAMSGLMYFRRMETTFADII